MVQQALLTGFGDDTHTSVKFRILLPTNRTPDWRGAPRISQFDIPHSDRTVTQFRGRSPMEITFRLWLETIDDLDFLDGLLGTRQTLRYVAGITKKMNGTIETLGDTKYLNLPNTMLLDLGEPSIQVGGVSEVDATFQRAGESSAYYGFAVYAEDDAP